VKPRFAALTALTLGLPLLLAAGPVRAQADGRLLAPVEVLRADVDRLRTDLDRTNAEVAALKRAGRGVPDDFRLRRKLAEAEALARELTEAEAELRRRGVLRPTPGPAPALGAAPRPDPGDGPAELEAKADILADQARRLTAEAEALGRVAAQVRNRQTLRRRAGQLDRDPFVGLETSRRNTVVAVPRPTARALTEAPALGGGGVRARTPAPMMPDFNDRSSLAAPTMSPPPGDQAAPGQGTGGAAAPAGPPPPSPSPTSPPPGMPRTPEATPESAPGTSGPETSPAPPSMPSPSAPDDGAKGAPQPSPQSSGPTSTGGGSPRSTDTRGGTTVGDAFGAATPVELRFRALLDPATLAEIRRIESGGKPTSHVEALEHAAAALRARAQRLEEESKALRARLR
jgi:outer membrane murein-binding lipoprotein Lpp